MATVVIVPPAPIMTPADILGSHAADDATIAAYIASAQESIDGPNGWVGRSFGVQTLECDLAEFPCGRIELPCPPVVSLTSITYFDAAGVERAIDPVGVTLDKLNGVMALASGYWPATRGYPGSVRVRYVAGYNGVAPAIGGTGNIPVSVKQAITFMVQNASSTATASQDIKVVDVEGIERLEYFTSRADSATLVKNANGLLAGLRVFR